MKYLIRIILFPFSLVYDAVARLRNRLYDSGLRPSVQFSIPVICIGNLTVGGTGKTPFAEYLIRLVSSTYKTATLSRGYGRKTRGFRVASASDTAQTIGDEPLQVFRKYSPPVLVSVGEDRALAIAHLLQEHEDVQLVLLDDAFQHRRVRASLNVLLTDYNRPFLDDYVLPAGRLRESKVGAVRADVIVVTKCPDTISEEEMMNWRASLHALVVRPVFFTHIRYGVPVSFGRADAQPKNRVILVSGIASHTALREYVERTYYLVEHIVYRDHHGYSERDIRSWKCAEDTMILTTEKDMVKLSEPRFDPLIRALPIFYLPMEMEFVENGEEFDAFVLNHLEEQLSKHNPGVL